MIIAILIYAGIVAALVRAEYGRRQSFQRVLKPLAALAFILLALLSGALYAPYGVLVLWALIFCAVGDVCLLSRTRPILFKLGMAAFALGHVLYAYAFFTAGVALNFIIVTAIIMAAVNTRVYRYVSPHLTPDMRPPVMVYSVIIAFMVIFAVATRNIWIALPAIMFAVSDLFVARDRFVKTEPLNALILTPLYFGAQALFALSTAL